MLKRGDPGIEPGTSCTLNRNHTTRPIALLPCLSSLNNKRTISRVTHDHFESSDACPADRALVGRFAHRLQAVTAQTEVIAGLNQSVGGGCEADQTLVCLIALVDVLELGDDTVEL